jgi:hypothetical protein
MAWQQRNDGIPALVVALVISGGEGEVLMHRGAEIEVNIGRNDEKNGRWWCSPRKGMAAAFSLDSGDFQGALETVVEKWALWRTMRRRGFTVVGSLTQMSGKARRLSAVPFCRCSGRKRNREGIRSNVQVEGK